MRKSIWIISPGKGRNIQKKNELPPPRCRFAVFPCPSILHFPTARRSTWGFSRGCAPWTPLLEHQLRLEKDVQTSQVYMGVSENRATPKSSMLIILIGFSIINHPSLFFWKHPYTQTKSTYTTWKGSTVANPHVCVFGGSWPLFFEDFGCRIMDAFLAVSRYIYTLQIWRNIELKCPFVQTSTKAW